MFLGKPWIEKDQVRRKEEEDIEQKKKELRDFMARIIVCLIEEQHDKSKKLRAKYQAIEVERTQEDLKHLSI
jgi:5-methylcytosine-specific restriction endonuclease McrBC GTP-binding regulatory subunit McrB